MDEWNTTTTATHCQEMPGMVGESLNRTNHWQKVSRRRKDLFSVERMGTKEGRESGYWYYGAVRELGGLGWKAKGPYDASLDRSWSWLTDAHIFTNHHHLGKGRITWEGERKGTERYWTDPVGVGEEQDHSSESQGGESSSQAQFSWNRIRDFQPGQGYGDGHSRWLIEWNGPARKAKGRPLH